MFFFYRNNNRYRPYIKYNWSTTTDPLTGVRRLKDAGTAPKFPATMYSGRGIKFNGVDQNITVPYTIKDTSDTFTISVSTKISSNIDKTLVSIGLSTKCRITIAIRGVGLVVSLYNGTDFTYRGSPDIIAGKYTNITTTYDYTKNKIRIFIDGKEASYITGTSLSVWGDIKIGSSYADGFLYDDLINNVMAFSTLLSDTEVQYLHSNPEKFLYREDNILKSKILPQEKIDAVEFYAPMCETDGYIRDYSKYSEGDNVINFPLANWGIGNSTDTSTVTEDADGNIIMTYDSTDNTALNFSQAVPEVGYYIMTITIDSINGAVKVQDTDSNALFGVFSTSGTFSSVGYIDASKLYVYRNYAGEDVSAVISNITLSKIQDGIYPITNYTSDQNVNQVSTGLQTCFWERDILGVPNRLIEKGSISNLHDYKGFDLQNTFSIFENGERYYGIEVLLLPIKLSTASDFYIIRNTDGFALLIYPDGILRAFQKIDDTTFSNVVLITPTNEGTPIHVYLEYVDDGIDTLISTPYINGVVGTQYTYTYTTKNIQSVSEVLFNYSQKYQIETRLFNIHIEPQDPLELYNNAVKKGLLQ